MRLCVPLFLLLFLPITGPAETTPTEAAAITAAKNDHSAYTLPPERLAQAEAIGRIRIALTFGDPIWEIVSLFLLLQLGIARRMRNVAVNLSPNRWVQGFSFFLLFLLAMTLLQLPIDIYAQHVRLSYGLSV
jgi:STE24 endopeptidase